MKNIHWPINETYLKKDYCCVVGCKKRPKYEYLTEHSEGTHDTILACEEHLPKGSVPK
jgi:hypothetical protein